MIIVQKRITRFSIWASIITTGPKYPRMSMFKMKYFMVSYLLPPHAFHVSNGEGGHNNDDDAKCIPNRCNSTFSQAVKKHWPRTIWH